MNNLQKIRMVMIEKHLRARGIKDPAVLRAMEEVPRHMFLPEKMKEFAYEDSPLPIGEGQTISQPYIVAVMTEMLELKKHDRVLEIGTGSGYAAAVLSRIVDEVYTVERYRSLTETAKEAFRRMGYDNIHVHRGDGSLGWPDNAPYDAIVVAAGSPEVPHSLKEQLALGGRLVIPTGSNRSQKLVRIRRIGENEFEQEDMFSVRFVPLVGDEGWQDNTTTARVTKADPARDIPEMIEESAEHISSIKETGISALLDRIGDARVVLLGEASHGTKEFYEMRARITLELMDKKGFNIVAIEGDWPDVAQVNSYIQGGEAPVPPVEKPFKRFPTWMWANTSFAEFVESMLSFNSGKDVPERVSLYGLDLYSLYNSIESVLDYLDNIDADTAALARRRYGCLTPWQQDPAAYGAAALTGRYQECENEVVKMLQDLLNRRVAYESENRQGFLDAVQNARIIKNAEHYYRAMYYGSRESWNLRDGHMFDTLNDVLDHHGSDSRAVVWEHNSHIGNAAATEMGISGEKNVGLFCREAFGEDAYLIGFGTDHGTVGAASQWDRPMEMKRVNPSHRDSYEYLCHQVQKDNFLLPLRHAPGVLRKVLSKSRLERAIGVIYMPETELQSHYFYAELPRQFDEYIWFDETHAVSPLTLSSGKGFPETFPFGV